MSDSHRHIIIPNRPLSREEEYFAKQEAEKLRKLRAEAEGKMAEEEKRRLRDLHFMHCPKCGQGLTEIDFQGLRLDKCFSCEGIWFDGGELEALVAKGEKEGILARLKGFFD